MSDNPTLVAVMILAASYAAWMWWGDLRAARAGQAKAGAFPGATPWAPRLLWVAALGSLVLLGLETWGEYGLGVSEEQKKITVLFGVYTLCAGFLEELIFRGYLVIDRKGRTALWVSIVAFSLIFAVIHPFLWDFKAGPTAWKFWEGEWTWQLTRKAWFSTIVTFVVSLWFYLLRFAPQNTTRSLAPSVVAHVTKNLGVFAIKAIQGHVSGLW